MIYSVISKKKQVILNNASEQKSILATMPCFLKVINSTKGLQKKSRNKHCDYHAQDLQHSYSTLKKKNKKNTMLT